MISEDFDCFPNNVVNLLGAAMATIDTDISIVKRPMQMTDDDQTIAVVAIDWAPDTKTKEIAGVNPAQPTSQTYKIAVQGLIVDMDEEAGLMRNSAFAKLIRDILYTNQPTRIALSKLEVLNGTGQWVEKALTWDVVSQKYHNNEVDGNFLYLSTLELWFKTQVRT